MNRVHASSCPTGSRASWRQGILAPYGKDEHERGESVSKDDLVQLEGKVVSVGKGGTFTVEIEGGHQVMAKLAGKMRRARIRVVLGDEVRVAVSPYDPSHGLIVYRKR